MTLYKHVRKGQMNYMISVCYTADEEYAMQVSVSLVSMLESNRKEDFTFYILANNYSEKVRKKFKIIEEKYNCRICIINIENKMKMLLDTKLACEPGAIRNGMISFIFARLFVGSGIPESVDRVIYIDSDTLFLGKAKELYDIELSEDYLFAAVRDLWPVEYNSVIGLKRDELYFQSGIMLINLKKWREEQCENKILNHINTLSNYYALHDQDILNICFRGNIQTLPVKFGMVYLLRAYNARQILEFSGKDEEHYYKEKEINEAKKKPYVIHFSGDFFGRPWIYPKACADSRMWYSYYKLTPWDERFLREKYKTEYGIKYRLKWVLYPFTKTLWLRWTRQRLQNVIEGMYVS